MSRRFWALLGVVLSFTAVADFPSKPGEDTWDNRPNDPGYSGAWHLYSHLPKDHRSKVSELEKKIGSGLSVDKAWQLHTGTPDTVVAVLDSGIFWDERDLLERFSLNRKELPLPQNASEYDANHDGRFSVSDYANDSRVGDRNANGILDPEDLILAFSNGDDADGNGYIDDICGWDFHEHDNNPYDRTRFGHGTGEAKDSTAALNNGMGDAGVCGNCGVVPLRVNDSFVVDANAFAAAVRYATDLKVNLIQQALGSVNYSSFTKEAINYAYANNVPIIGSAADECSYHHNYPSTLDPVIYANAIRYDTPKYQDATTFLNFNNCSNFGARVDVSVPALHCSSEATGLLSGVSLLALSYAKSLGRALAPLELNSLIKASATDINLGAAAPGSERYSSYEGWDSLTGYGRANAFEMLTRIRENRIPPTARIVSPEWFELFRSNVKSDLKVEIEGGARAGNYSAELEVVAGVDTSQGERRVLWTTSAPRTGQLRESVSVILSSITTLAKNPIDVSHFKHAYTLRLRVRDEAGSVAEARKTIYIFDDPDLYANFPKAMNGSGESAGVFADLNNDGKEEYVTADGNGYIHAYTYPDGELSGFPAASAPSRYAKGVLSSIVSPVAIADVNGDGRLDIVTISLEGALAVVDSLGKPLSGFPLYLPFPKMEESSPSQVISQGSYAAPVLVDLNKDGAKEIVIPAMDGLVHAYDYFGKTFPGFPVALEVQGKRAKILSSPAVYDVNSDGTLDLIVGSNFAIQNNGYLFAIDGRGNLAPRPIVENFPAMVPLIRDGFLPTVGMGIPASPLIADLNQDGTTEIVIQPFVGRTYAFSLTGKLMKSYSMKVGQGHNTNDQYMISALGNPALGDITGSKKFNVISPGVGKRMLVAVALGGKRYDHDHMVGAWDNASGTMLDSFPRKIDDLALSPSPVTGDLDNDGKEDVVMGSGGYFLHAFNEKGEIPNFPKFTGGWTYASASIGDFDGDKNLDVAVTTREGNVFIWRTEGKKGALSWRTFKGGPARLGTVNQ